MKPQEIPSTLPDWSREQKHFFTWNPPRSLLTSIRSYQTANKFGRPLAALIKK